MAKRALDFAKLHPVTDTGFDAVVKRLEAAVAQGNAQLTDQVDGSVGELAAIRHRQEIRREISQLYLQRLYHVVAAAMMTTPDLAATFPRIPGMITNKEFLSRARSLLTAATAHQEILVPLGLGDKFLAGFGAALDAFEGSTDTAHAGRSTHVGARWGFEVTAGEIMRDVAILGSFYREAFPNDVDLQAAWASSKNVAGPFKRIVEEPVPSPVPSPEPPKPAEGSAA